ncbi:MAG: DUF3153 domain-containing protein, partial [Cyanobacteria bacterium Co-bin8]|nr:DUF3153 domain-containing protein [Cyanobacteria bacterium Co-bin8]
STHQPSITAKGTLTASPERAIIVAALAPATKPRRRWLPLLLSSLLMFLLSGCFQYDLGIEFDSQTHGQIVQQIRLSERAAALGGSAVQTWLAGLETQVRSLGGQVRRPDSETLRLVVPFGNGSDLVKRFNQLFQAEAAAGAAIADLTDLPSRLSLSQQNRVVAIRNHLVCDLDLRALPRQPQNIPGLLGGATDWLELHFTLQTPWGLGPLGPDSLAPEGTGPVRTWLLQPGEINHIDAVFWVPSPLGLGGLAIAALVLLGYFFKYGLRRGRRQVKSGG